MTINPHRAAALDLLARLKHDDSPTDPAPASVLAARAVGHAILSLDEDAAAVDPGLLDDTDTTTHVEIGGQRMTEAAFNAARRPLLEGVASNSEREQLQAVYGRGDAPATPPLERDLQGGQALVLGGSDDLIEIYGSVSDEYPAYNGGTIAVDLADGKPTVILALAMDGDGVWRITQPQGASPSVTIWTCPPDLEADLGDGRGIREVYSDRAVITGAVAAELLP